MVVSSGGVGHRLQRHGMVKLQGVGSGHRRTSADGVQQTREGRAPARGWEGSGGRRARGSPMSRSEDATPCLRRGRGSE